MLPEDIVLNKIFPFINIHQRYVLLKRLNIKLNKEETLLFFSSVILEKPEDILNEIITELRIMQCYMYEDIVDYIVIDDYSICQILLNYEYQIIGKRFNTSNFFKYLDDIKYEFTSDISKYLTYDMALCDLYYIVIRIRNLDIILIKILINYNKKDAPLPMLYKFSTNGVSLCTYRQIFQINKNFLVAPTDIKLAL